ncbi:TLR adapter interacting with SLC15A4 on the lysosome-like [Heterodontus francisci]|uniref:TLR adapter interacting with SLC15A4 on the lysosome-like n=1 Tax=Heterodontus francisci TaxID=7792 RepID=UPI00355B3C52
MLAEGFLTGIGYSHHQRECTHQHNCANSRKTPKTSTSSWEELFSSLEFTESIENKQHSAEENIQSSLATLGSTSHEKGEPLQVQSQEEVTGVNTRVPMFERKSSDILDIPNNSRHNVSDLDLYRSWSTTCQSYTDLQIAGDNVTPSSPTSSCCFMDHDYKSCNWPTIQIENQSIWSSIPGCCCEGQQPFGTDAFFTSDKSIALLKEPLSNSVLNRYMEQKITELYKQYLEDNMTKCASPTKILGSHFLMTNIDQISLQISHEKNMEPTKAKDIVLNCLFSVACATNSSDICTPNLQISSQQTDELVL